MIAAYREPDRKKGRQMMVKLIGSVSHGVPAALTEAVTLGRTLTLTKRADDVLAYFDRPGTSNGPTEAIKRQARTPPRISPRVPQPHQLHRQMPARDRRVQTPTTPRIVKSLFAVHPTSEQGRTRLNYVTHFALGTRWGAAYGVAARVGLPGKPAVVAVFATVSSGDVLLSTALGLYQPSKWSTQDIVVDVLDKFVQASATGAIFDRFLDPLPRS